MDATALTELATTIQVIFKEIFEMVGSPTPTRLLSMTTFRSMLEVSSKTSIDVSKDVFEKELCSSPSYEMMTKNDQ